MAESAIEVRNSVIAHLRTNHPDMCRHWFNDIQAVEYDGGTLTLLVSEPVQLKFLQARCLDKFNESAQASTGRLVAVRFVNDEQAQALLASKRVPKPLRNGSVASHARSSSTDYHDLPVTPDYSFENFVVGPNNRLAHAAAQAIAQRPGEAYNPFFVHGGVGLGKTHLIQAIYQKIHEDHPDRNIYYVSCDNFTNQFMDSVQAGEMHDFRNRFRNVDVLMIDDIHFLSKRDQTQEEFFHTFNTLHQTGRQIILSSDAPPNEIPHLEDRLVSRFNSGLVVQIDKPDFETRVAILRKKAGLRGMVLPDDVAAYIGSIIDNNIRELEGAITKLRLTSSISDGEIDLVMAKEILGAQIIADLSHQPSVQTIIEIVCEYYDVKLTDILSKRKFKSIAEPRQICMWLARKLTRYSLEEIGGYFGGRDHTTVLHAIRTIERRIGFDERIRKDIASLEMQLVQPAA